MNGLFVITGGPGTGKSTLIESLRKEGFPCFNEVSREIIAKSHQAGTDLLPWQNLQAFANECYLRMQEQLQLAHDAELCFFDRAIPDIIAYLQFGGITPSKELYKTGRSYAKLVFVAPPWEDIFVNDAERPQTFEQCQQLHNLLLATYVELGYQIAMIPKTSVEERKFFVMNTVIDFYFKQHTPKSKVWKTK